MNRLLNTLFVVSVGAALSLPALAQQNSTKTPQDSDSAGMGMSKGSAGTASADSMFIKKAARGGLAEVELGKLAQEKASSEEVKKFGERMVNDHTKANDQLKQVAEQEHVQLPQSLDAKDKATKDRLEKLSGEAFDRAYMQDMVKDHKKDVAEFEHESKMAKDPAVKSFAEQTLPTLREHLQMAEKIAPQQQGSMHSKNTIPKNDTGSAQ